MYAADPHLSESDLRLAIGVGKLDVVIRGAKYFQLLPHEAIHVRQPVWVVGDGEEDATGRRQRLVRLREKVRFFQRLGRLLVRALDDDIALVAVFCSWRVLFGGLLRRDRGNGVQRARDVLSLYHQGSGCPLGRMVDGDRLSMWTGSWRRQLRLFFTVQPSPHPTKEDLLRTTRKSCHLFRMRLLELPQRILRLLRASAAFQNVPGDFRKAIRQPVHVAPVEFSRIRHVSTVHALQPAVTDLYFFSLTSPGFSISLGESAQLQLLCQIVQIVGQKHLIFGKDQSRKTVAFGVSVVLLLFGRYQPIACLHHRF
mmetsp:Transcript_7252/g.21314  ORF Transcript_7252/g.21314 Transcript_7252/m.21314 type:complete len:312 (+) Transcript_7252:926-1861(+)